jgi:hypothetical protein
VFEFEQPVREALSDAYPSLTEEDPDADSRALFRSYLDDLAEGDLRSALATLAAHRDELGKGLPLLEQLYQATVAAALGGANDDLPIQDYARRMFYLLRIDDQLRPAGQTVVSISEADVREGAGEALRGLLDTEANPDQLEHQAKRLLQRSLLELLWREAAKETIGRGGSFFHDRWLKPEGIDFFLESAYGALTELPRIGEDELVRAFSGFPHLVAQDADCEGLRGKVAHEAVLPRLIHHSWPEGARVMIEEIDADPALATGGRDTIVASLKKLSARR